MSKVGVFVDTSDLYHKVQRKFGRGSKVCYATYYDTCDDQGDLIDVAVAYGMQNDTHSFPNCLAIVGFDTKFKPPRVFTTGDRKIKKCDWNVALTLDVVNWVLERIASYGNKTVRFDDILILGSSNNLLVPLVKWVKEQGVKVVIFASCVPRNLKEVADEVIEVGEDCLEMEEVTN